jgi:hypothetical protein
MDLRVQQLAVDGLCWINIFATNRDVCASNLSNNDILNYNDIKAINPIVLHSDMALYGITSQLCKNNRYSSKQCMTSQERFGP